jgi:hypothetical protein
MDFQHIDSIKLTKYNLEQFKTLYSNIEDILINKTEFIDKYLTQSDISQHYKIIKYLNCQHLYDLNTYIKYLEDSLDYKLLIQQILDNKVCLDLIMTKDINFELFLPNLISLDDLSIFKLKYNDNFLRLLLNIFFLFSNEYLSNYIQGLFRLFSNSTTTYLMPIYIKKKHTNNILKTILLHTSNISKAYPYGLITDIYTKDLSNIYKSGGFNIINMNYNSVNKKFNVLVYTPLLCYVFIKKIIIECSYTWHDGINEGFLENIDVILSQSLTETRPTNYIELTTDTKKQCQNYKTYIINSNIASISNMINLEFTLQSFSKLHIHNIIFLGDVLFLV